MTKTHITIGSIILSAAVIAGVIIFTNKQPIAEQGEPIKNEDISSVITTTTTFVSSKPTVSEEKPAVEVNRLDIDKAEIAISQEAFEYTGSEITLDPNNSLYYTIELNGQPLPEQEYRIEYSNNIEAGYKTAKATFIGEGNNIGKKEISFSIVPKPIDSAIIDFNDGKLHIEWGEVSGACGYQILIAEDQTFKKISSDIETTDLSVSLNIDLNPGDAVYCKIRPYVANSEDDKLYGEYSPVFSTQVYGIISNATLSADSFTYDEQEHLPNISVYGNNGILLTPNKDYIVKKTNSKTPGSYIIEAEGINTYKGSVSKTYYIIPARNNITDIQSTDNNIFVTWKKDTLADGYILIYSQNPDFSNYRSFIQGDVNKNTANLVTYPKAGQKWYVKICSFKYTDATYSSWKGWYSDSKSITVAGKEPEPIKPADKTKTEEVKKPEIIQPQNSEGNVAALKTTIQKMIAGYNGSWSIYVENLRTEESFTINNRSYYPASLMKMFCMAATYQKIEEGKVAEKDVYNLLKDMITVSSNDAFNQLVVRKIGTTAVRDWINNNGYTNTYQCAGYAVGSYYQQTIIGPGTNQSTVYDCGKLLESIYKGTCVSKEASEKMLNLLKAQTIRYKIPNVIPSNVVVANKTGEVANNNHDCAIVFLNNNPYIICVMSENIGNAMGYTWCIRNISKTVYNYMASLK